MEFFDFSKKTLLSAGNVKRVRHSNGHPSCYSLGLVVNVFA